ncbi:tRNA pseudouridine 13 synthase [Halorhodospira halochloris]|uniref:tRNA pseudouridine synthase D n=1 Tax=Halorhodospira halochloris TaxID=1052 RepID=A0A110B548_HALHR|nr:tRNA pseudouridine(13) synthase TruD [Halorhodospira halochloris]MBK1651206.1 hypothetical protein [Halorhodospira halochloris]BAU57478.1 tRNA pseudouridine 13 synthase [Halorhodospira halochloris]
MIPAYPPLPGTATARTYPEDFIVTEVLGFTPSGDGEHHLLQLRKRGWTTEAVAGLLARHFGLARSAVSYAGRKDRHAETTQWFSLHAPGDKRSVEPGQIAEGVEVIAATRNDRKLRIGSLRANKFVITLRSVEAPRGEIDKRLVTLAHHGMPNYFGEQRFGRDGDNFEQACAWLLGEKRVRNRSMRSTLLSAARAELFNRVLAERVGEGSWDRVLSGERAMLDASHSHFAVVEADKYLASRARHGLVHPTGPLPGQHRDAPEGVVGQLEERVLAPAAELIAALERQGLKAQRRALRVMPRNLRWQWRTPDRLEVSFQLPAGSYASILVREIVRTRT